MKTRVKGFTLLELMIVVAIIGILGAVGYPSYMKSVKKGQRADAIDSLLELAGSMEEYYMQNDTYTGATISNTTKKSKSSEGLYKLSIPVKQDFYYKIRATPVTADTDCGKLQLDSTGKKFKSGILTVSDWW